MTTLAPLPIYPSSQARKGFSLSQLTQFHYNLSNALTQVISLPPAKRDTPPTRAFISTYANDAANQILEALIWENAEAASSQPQAIDHLRQRVLLLAEKLASAAPGLELKTLLDLCVAFPSKITRLRAILAAALGGTPDLPSRFTSEVVSAFTTSLSPAHSSGLYGLRKTARCLVSFLRPSPPALVRPFAHNKEFILALARAYDSGLTAISRSYGGIRTGIASRELDHWERIWLDTKVDIVDAFHITMSTMVQDVTSAFGTQLAVEADRAFGIVFALLEVTPESVTAASADPVPFLNRSLVADYQHAYDLKRTLAGALRRSSRDDARMELLESTLRSLDVESSGGSARDPGALKLILRSSGIAPGVSTKATLVPPPALTDKGKGKATAPEPSSSHDPDLDLQVTQVLDIFPDHSPEYIRNLLMHPSYPFRGNAERVIEALLEGTAPDEDSVEGAEDFSSGAATGQGHITLPDAPIERRNVFDEEVIDVSSLHIGKKIQDASSLVVRDRAEIERMKLDTLRLTEAMSDDSDEEDTGRPRALDVLDLDDDFEGAGPGTVKVVGDGEDSGDDEATEERGTDPHKPETTLELAYIRDPKLFERDAQTRRSKARTELKQQTGWTDEQIEGWKIMLERNPKKERILQKHEFAGNRIEDTPIVGSSAGSSGDRGRGRGGGRGRGRGGGGRGGVGETSDSVARDRAFKNKHKNQNRKRGHDKKMARAGAGPST